MTPKPFIYLTSVTKALPNKRSDVHYAEESSHDGRHQVEVGQLEEQQEERTAGRREEDSATSYFLDAGLNSQPQSLLHIESPH
ncbi:uncharacterized protein IAS62_001921 [Cryptococcus decagattii]|uniref:Uncharacterized protein n=1 Tax=Cryptococcus decagattii TaxID=1859122 RepID=A0ABZ2AQD8_9TREE